ncbi:hypothetical protein K437DRAFT_189843 [Tilletiaria anomala UBC 951]|uniref:Uncharacterized protein n=1 Tax=Tilletiaria anomala (strain ATCC 24038 / CBS 436.72 / UBC 951) TaxID=1037660 RepID=A0A066VJ87_TILAU|nr:uncharacterized protein K437DRAFT_189843 [Tilletiaria anomala UBC 951]KDN40333.1 hypothetical protein K437DRAFT_189843 [Tilletiaria anomala UBC 951]
MKKRVNCIEGEVVGTNESDRVLIAGSLQGTLACQPNEMSWKLGGRKRCEREEAMEHKCAFTYSLVLHCIPCLAPLAKCKGLHDHAVCKKNSLKLRSSSL